MAIQIQIRRDTATNWSNTNPVLAQGEFGYELDTGKLKIGDGVSHWNDLPYFSAGASPGGEEGSVQFKIDNITFGGDSYFKYSSSDIQLIIDDTNAPIVPANKPPIFVKSTRNYLGYFEHTTGNAMLKIISTSSDIFSRIAGIHLFSGTDSFGSITFGNNILMLNTSATTGKVEIMQNFDFDRNKIIFPIKPAPTDNPISGKGYLYADDNDNHLKWKISDGTIFDLCAPPINPGGSNQTVQFNDSGTFQGVEEITIQNASNNPYLYLNDQDRAYESEYGILYINHFSTINTTDVKSSRGVSIYKKVTVNEDNSGSSIAFLVSSIADGNQSKTLSRLYCQYLHYGIYEESQISISDMYGLFISPNIRYGNATRLYSIYIASANNTGGGTYGTHFALYSADINAVNYFAGRLRLRNRIELKNQDSDPDDSIPNYGFIYSKTDGYLYWKNNNGNIYNLCEVATPQGPDEAIQFNDNGNFAGLPNFTIDNEASPPILYITNNDIFGTHSGILQVRYTDTISSDITTATYSRNATFYRVDEINADASELRTTNTWDIHFIEGSGNVYYQTTKIIHHGIYATDATVTISNSVGLSVITYLKSGTIDVAKGISISTSFTNYPTKYYPIYQDGSYGLNKFEAKVGIGNYENFTEKLYVEGDVWVRGDDKYFIITCDDYVISQIDDNIYFGVKSGDGYILQGLDYIKYREVINLGDLPSAAESGYGMLYSYERDLFWRDSNGNTYKLNISPTYLSPLQVVLTDGDGKLTTQNQLTYLNGGGIKVYNGSASILVGITSAQRVVDIISTATRTEFSIRNQQENEELEFLISVHSANDDALQNVIQLGTGTNASLYLSSPLVKLYSNSLTNMDFRGVTYGPQLRLYSNTDPSTAPDDCSLYMKCANAGIVLDYSGWAGGYHDILKSISTGTTFRLNHNPSGRWEIYSHRGNDPDNMSICIDEYGQVGIGIIPQEKFHVNGNIRYERSFYKKLSFTVPAATTKWIRIAVSGSSAGINFGIFKVYYTVSGNHGNKVFMIGADFNYETGFNCVVLHSDYYVRDCIQKIRILSNDNDTYAQMYLELEIYNPHTSYDMTVYIEQDYHSKHGWELLDSAQDGSIPTDYTEYVYNVLGYAFAICRSNKVLFGINYAQGQFYNLLRATYFRPTSGYQSVAGNVGITTTLNLRDGYNDNVYWKLTFENGILVSATSSTVSQT